MYVAVTDRFDTNTEQEEEPDVNSEDDQGAGQSVDTVVLMPDDECQQDFPR